MEQRIPWPAAPSTSYARPLVASPGGARPRSRLLAAAGRRSGQSAARRGQRGPSGQHTAWQPRQPAAAAPGAQTTGRGRVGCAKAVRSQLQLARCWCAAARRLVPPPLHGTATSRGAAAPDCPSAAFKSTSFTKSCAPRFDLLPYVFCHTDSMSKIDQIR